METAMNHGLCRCCASEGSFKDLENTYDWLGTKEVYADMLKDCFDISLSKQDNYNNGGICEVCITQLRNASNFKKQVQFSEQQFLKKVGEDSFKPNTIKIEVLRSDDHDIFDDGNQSDEFSSPEYDIPLTKIKVEKLSETKPKKRTAKASKSKAKKLKKEDGEPPLKRNTCITAKKNNKTKTDKLSGESSENQASRGGELEKHRTNIREIILYSNATPIRCRGGIGYACCFCLNQYPNPTDLKQHIIDFHDEECKANFMKGSDMYSYIVKLDITSLKCSICSVGFESLEPLMEHLKYEHYRNICIDIKNHIVPFKFNGETLRCFMCQNVFNKFKALQEHMNTHYRNYICEVCDAGFVNRRLLLCHKSAHATGTFGCEKCPKVFDTIRKRKWHERIAHNNLNLPHKCGYCDERFKENYHKNEHLARVHGVVGPAKICKACDKTFSTQQAFILHTKRFHLMQRLHRCTTCEMAFYSKRELTDHTVKHTGTREYKCEICFKSYGRSKTLKEHVRRIHFEERGLKCNECGQLFAKSHSLKTHLMVKHGI